MHRALLDTDVLSEILKRGNPQVLRAARAYRSAYGRYTTSSITVLEVIAGCRRVADDARLERFLAMLEGLEVLDVDRDAARWAGYIHGDLLRAGRGIGRMDPMIAAVAISNGLPLVTGNREHFERVRALAYPLELESWG